MTGVTMRRNPAALLGALTLAFFVPGLASAHAHIAYQGRWHTWTQERDYHHWQDRHADQGKSVATGARRPPRPAASRKAGLRQAPRIARARPRRPAPARRSTVTRSSRQSTSPRPPTVRRTLNGNPLVTGDVAVDPSLIPLGRWLWVQGSPSRHTWRRWASSPTRWTRVAPSRAPHRPLRQQARLDRQQLWHPEGHGVHSQQTG